MVSLNASKNVIKFSWEGDEKGKDGFKLFVTAGSFLSGAFDYNEPAEFEIPITSHEMEIVIESTAKDGGKKSVLLKHTYKFESDEVYCCRLSGRITDFSGLSLQMCTELEEVENQPKLKNNVPIAILSFLFPIYGIINALRADYNRVAALVGAVSGFILAMCFSAMAGAGDKIAFGIGHYSLIEYKAFSITDIIINILIGGVSSLRGFLYLFLE